MANNVNNAGGELLFIQIGNGATPEVFAASATINTSRAFSQTVKTSTTELADTVNPSNAAVTARQVMSTDSKFDGKGVADAPSLLTLINWANAPGAGPKNCKITFNRTGAAGGFTVTGPYILTSLSLDGNARESLNFSASFEQAGAPTITANA